MYIKHFARFEAQLRPAAAVSLQINNLTCQAGRQAGKIPQFKGLACCTCLARTASLPPPPLSLSLSPSQDRRPSRCCYLGGGVLTYLTYLLTYLSTRSGADQNPLNCHASPPRRVGRDVYRPEKPLHRA